MLWNFDGTLTPAIRRKARWALGRRGAADPKAGAARALYRLLGGARLNRQLAVVAGGAKRGVRKERKRRGGVAEPA